VAVLGSQLGAGRGHDRKETIMVARFVFEDAELRARHSGDSFAIPEEEELENGAVQAALRGNAEALKRAARDQVTEHYSHLEQRCVYGCVDWYQYPEGEQQSPTIL
jgi:hypothetical protein